MKELTRREFLQISGGVTLVTLTPSKPKEVRTIDILGVHLTPYPGGGVELESQFRYANRLRAKGVTIINPDQKTMEEAAKYTGQVTARFDHRPLDGRFKPKPLRDMVKIVANYTSTPLILSDNEPNNKAETGGVFIPPEKYTLTNVIPAAEVILSSGGMPALPALDQTQNDLAYLTTVLRIVKQQYSSSYIRNNFFLPVHSYSFSSLDNPWFRIALMDETVAREINGHLPIVITEGGIHPELATTLTKDGLANETLRLLNLPVPNIKVWSFNWWVLMNLKGRPEKDRFPKGATAKEVADFESVALIRLSGPTKAYHNIVQLKNSRL